MGLFCLLWIPLAYFLRRSIAAGRGGGGVWPLILGSAAVIAQFFAGPLVYPGGFGFSRWASGFVDVVSVPALAPLVLYLLFVEMGFVSPKEDCAGFALLWLFPLSGFRAAGWISPPSPVMLVLVPALWSAIALGIPAMAARAKKCESRLAAAPLALCIAALPFAAATSWWAFYSHLYLAGFLLFLASAAPALASTAAALSSMAMARKHALAGSGEAGFSGAPAEVGAEEGGEGCGGEGDLGGEPEGGLEAE